MIEFALVNWRWILPLLVIAGLGIDDGRLRIQVANRNVTIADMKTQEARNIAAALEAARKFREADAKRSAMIIAGLNTEKTALEAKYNAATVALAEVPPPVEPPGCPDPLDRSDVRAFIDGLPPDDAGGKTGDRPAGRPAGSQGKLPAPAR